MISTIVQFPAGSEPDGYECVSINIIDDFSVESKESFHITTSGAHFTRNSEATVVILDNDGMYEFGNCQFNNAVIIIVVPSIP